MRRGPRRPASSRRLPPVTGQPRDDQAEQADQHRNPRRQQRRRQQRQRGRGQPHPARVGPVQRRQQQSQQRRGEGGVHPEGVRVGDGATREHLANVAIAIPGFVLVTPFTAIAESTDRAVWELVGTALTTAITAPFVALYSTLLYYDLLTRR